jgi:hypothetical protein
MSGRNCRGGFLRAEHEGMLRGIALPDAVAALQQRAVRGSFLLPENKDKFASVADPECLFPDHGFYYPGSRVKMAPNPRFGAATKK